MRITRTIGIISIGLVVAFAATVRAAEQKGIPLYEGATPGSEAWTQNEVEFRDGAGKAMVRNVTTPTLTAFLPDAATSTGTAVVVCPGGGFRFLSWQSEGTEVAEWLQRRGVAALVLKYRLKETPADEGAFGREMVAFFLSLARPKNESAPGEANKARTCKRPPRPAPRTAGRRSGWSAAAPRSGGLSRIASACSASPPAP